MPYGGTTKAQDKKIEKCEKSDDWVGKTNPRTGKPYSRSEKIAICKSRVLKSSCVPVGDRYYQVSADMGVEPVESSDEGDEILTDCDGICESVAESARLTYQQRKNLPDSAFCLVYRERGKSGKMLKRRRFPAHDAAHVRNGLARLPQAKLTTAQKKTVRQCLISRARKYKIKVGESEIFADLYTTHQEHESRIENFGVSSIANDDGTFTVMAATEGQKARNPWTGEIYTLSREFLESNYKNFIGKFYYPDHNNKYVTEKRVAKIVASRIEEVEVDGKMLLSMFHDIEPRNHTVRADIENGFYDDVSIDIIDAKVSPDDEYLIVDGEAFGVAFVAGFGKMKGCPVCKVVHPIASSCLTHQSPTGTPSEEVPRHEKPEQEVISLTDGKDDPKPEDQEEGKDAPPKEGVSESVLADMKAEQKEMQSKIDTLEFGNAVQALATECDMKVETLMPVVSSDATPNDRLAALQSVVETFKAREKKIVESQVTKDDQKVKKDKEAGVYEPSEFESTLAKLEGKRPQQAASTEGGDAE